jgi:GntR family transcriptional regulator, rspAB operon transcriptional repressor
VRSAHRSKETQPAARRPASEHLPIKRAGPTQRTTTATLIYRDIHKAIVSMQVKPGAALNEKALSQQFGVSRTPVREALIRLVEDGLVDVFPQSGTFVARIPISAIPEAVLIRQALESATVEHAARIATAADIEFLDEIIARQRFFSERRDLNAFHEADEAFHEAIAKIGGHPGIWAVLKSVKVQIDRVRRLTLPALDRFQFILDDHLTIRNTIMAHDTSSALNAMKRHLTAVIPDVKALRDSYPDYFI